MSKNRQKKKEKQQRKLIKRLKKLKGMEYMTRQEVIRGEIEIDAYWKQVEKKIKEMDLGAFVTIDKTNETMKLLIEGTEHNYFLHFKKEVKEPYEGETIEEGLIEERIVGEPYKILFGVKNAEQKRSEDRLVPIQEKSV